MRLWMSAKRVRHNNNNNNTQLLTCYMSTDTVKVGVESQARAKGDHLELVKLVLIRIRLWI